MSELTAFGKRLRELRKEKGISLRDLADDVGDVSAAHLSDIELGRRLPSQELVRRIARAFRTSFEELDGLRPPTEELKEVGRMAESDPAVGRAVRRLVRELLAESLTADDIEQMCNQNRRRRRSRNRPKSEVKAANDERR